MPPKSGAPRDFTYADLAEETNRFANVLASLGVSAGERVFVLADRIPELYIAALGTLKNRSVFCPLFSAFGPEPIRARLTIGEGDVLVTTPALYRRKVAALRESLARLRHILLVGSAEEIAGTPATHDLRAMMAAASPRFTIPPTADDDVALLHFTSGTTGTPGASSLRSTLIVWRAGTRTSLDSRCSCLRRSRTPAGCSPQPWPILIR
ncbi:MAG: AMP-binding protein [Gemmatimonadaceae bacterium]|nr:AMP-binding protein [Gemmatimonadaceae bacterium]